MSQTPAATVATSLEPSASDDSAQLALGAVATGSSLALGARIHHRPDGLKLGLAFNLGRIFHESSWSFATLSVDLAYRPRAWRVLELGVYAGVHQGNPPGEDAEPGGLGPAGVRTSWRWPLDSGANLVFDLGAAYAGFLAESDFAVTGAVLYEFPR